MQSTALFTLALISSPLVGCSDTQASQSVPEFQTRLLKWIAESSVVSTLNSETLMCYPGFNMRGHDRKQACAPNVGEGDELRSMRQEVVSSACETAEAFCSPEIEPGSSGSAVQHCRPLCEV